MIINNKNVFTIEDIMKLFSVEKSTVSRWFKEGLKHFVVNRVCYVFEEELEAYFKRISK